MLTPYLTYRKYISDVCMIRKVTTLNLFFQSSPVDFVKDIVLKNQGTVC